MGFGGMPVVEVVVGAAIVSTLIWLAVRVCQWLDAWQAWVQQADRWMLKTDRAIQEIEQRK